LIVDFINPGRSKEADMGWVSFQADIIERRVRDEARIIFEDQYPLQNFTVNVQADSELTSAAQALGMTPEKLIALREWVQRVGKENKERLLRETTLVYTLNEHRTRVLAVEFISKEEAAAKYVVAGGDLLDLDCIYRGVLVRGRYIFVSESAAAQGLSRYEPTELLNGLIEEQCAA
jgi:hypothetical protein